ncbi:MAG TPA: LysR family transcriptional regulator [Lacunisphaera sp.]|nr:LysR family transcriptional regulator [Lacunisphaera sp.]
MFEKLFSERGLSFDRLRVIVEVHEAGGIAQAAPGDPVRQSQYSRQLRELSEFFGFEVAARKGRQLRLTPGGARLAELARMQLQALQDFRAEARAESVDYTIAAGDSLIQWLVIPRLAKTVARHAHVRFATSNLRTHDIVQQLVEGRVDFGVMRRDAMVPPLKSFPLGTLTFVFVAPRALLPAGKPLSLGEALGQLPFAAHTSDGQFTEKLRTIARKAGREMSPALTCESFPQTLAAVRTGGFAGILPSLALRELDRDKYAELFASDLHPLRRELVLAWNSRLVKIRPTARKLIEDIQPEWRL